MSKRVCLVTGASRGAGKGIAIALGGPDSIIYVTGRTTSQGQNPLPGTVHATCNAIVQRGGAAVPVICDHSDDAQVKKLFEQIASENGQLDILVNNATYIDDDLIKTGGFWSKSIDLVKILDVGLRSAYIASYYAAPLMLDQNSGLIVNTSSFGASCYMHGPANGAQKAGLDKMAWDMAHDLRPFGVAAVSIWMGMLRTERSQRAVSLAPEKFQDFMAIAESPEFTGKIIDALYHSEQRMQYSGSTLIGAELADQLGVQDIDGKQPISHREMLGGPASFSKAVVE